MDKWIDWQIDGRPNQRNLSKTAGHWKGASLKAVKGSCWCAFLILTVSQSEMKRGKTPTGNISVTCVCSVGEQTNGDTVAGDLSGRIAASFAFFPRLFFSGIHRIFVQNDFPYKWETFIQRLSLEILTFFYSSGCILKRFACCEINFSHVLLFFTSCVYAKNSAR